MNRPITFANHDEWLAARSAWVGASEVAIIVIPAAFRPRWMMSPYALWAAKRGVPQRDCENAAMRWGLRLERAIADEAVEQMQCDFSGLYAVAYPHSVWRHPDAPLAATPDRLLFTQDTTVIGLLECKTARSATDWADGPPLHYQIQVQAQLACTGLDRAWIAVLIGGCDFRLFPQMRNDKFISHMLKSVEVFWHHVVTGEPPDIDGSESTCHAIADMYDSDNGETVQLPPDFIEIDERLQQLDREIHSLTEEKSRLQNRIKSAIGNAKYGMLPHCKYTYSTVNMPEKTIPAKQYRVLRRAERRLT